MKGNSRLWIADFGLSVLLVGAVLATIGGAASAQGGYQVARSGYDLSWWTADGGGETFSTGGNYSLGGTIGQPDAGLLRSTAPRAVAGTGYTLAGGFWSGGGQLYRVYLPLVMRSYP